jgi:hypothetical protein
LGITAASSSTKKKRRRTAQPRPRDGYCHRRIEIGLNIVVFAAHPESRHDQILRATAWVCQGRICRKYWTAQYLSRNISNVNLLAGTLQIS